jgi:hypothetical protein
MTIYIRVHIVATHWIHKWSFQLLKRQQVNNCIWILSASVWRRLHMISITWVTGGFLGDSMMQGLCSSSILLVDFMYTIYDSWNVNSRILISVDAKPGCGIPHFRRKELIIESDASSRDANVPRADVERHRKETRTRICTPINKQSHSTYIAYTHASSWAAHLLKSILYARFSLLPLLISSLQRTLARSRICFALLDLILDYVLPCLSLVFQHHNVRQETKETWRLYAHCAAQLPLTLSHSRCHALSLYSCGSRLDFEPFLRSSPQREYLHYLDDAPF